MSINTTHNYHNIVGQEQLPWKSPANGSTQKSEEFWGEDGLTFKDLVDIVNPLHHIPVVSDIYESVTGDTKSTGSDLAGGAVFGGILGFAFSYIDSIIKEGTGKTMNENLMALFTGDSVDALENKSNVAADSLAQPNRIARYYEKREFVAPKDVGVSSATPATQADIAIEVYNRIQDISKTNLPEVLAENSSSSKYTYLV